MGIGEIIVKATLLIQQNKVAELERLEDSIIQSGDAKCIFYYAKNIKVADIPKLEDALIKTGDAYYIYFFARGVKGADIAKLWKAIQATNDQTWINQFKSDILSKHPEILEAEEYPHMLDTDDEPLEFIDID